MLFSFMVRYHTCDLRETRTAPLPRVSNALVQAAAGAERFTLVDQNACGDQASGSAKEGGARSRRVRAIGEDFNQGRLDRLDWTHFFGQVFLRTKASLRGLRPLIKPQLF